MNKSGAEYMGTRHFLILIFIVLKSYCLLGKEIVVGVKPIPMRTMSLHFTPMVLPDLISAKAAFEYRIHPKFNLVIPLEAKWMDYNWIMNGGDNEVENLLGREDDAIRILWNINFLQFKISSGVGIKWLPLSESMYNAFFLKTLLMVGFEHFNAYEKDGEKDSAVFTHVFAVGYQWVLKKSFTFGFELGEEYTWHTNPIKELPALIKGFMPFLQVNVGFTF
jgi:hypothetical protein